MYLVWIGVVLLLAKWLELGPLADISWWWILSPLALAFVWFEVLEPLLGMDKRKANQDADRVRRERVAAQFSRPEGKRAPR